MDIQEFIQAVGKHIREADPIELLVSVLGTIAMALAIIIVFNILQLIIGTLLKKHLNGQRTLLLKKSIKYTGFIMALLFIFKSMGIDTSALLGAAGVVGIIIGFAAQTTVSSLLSGLFLLSEKSFKVGDTIQIGNTLGIILSVDLLSVKVRTFDNIFVRIPNETLIQNNLMTLSRFPIRRLDLTFTVAYSEDLEKIRDVVLDITAKNHFVLVNPGPLFRVDKLDLSGVQIILNVWFDSNYLLDTKTSMLMDIKQRFEKECIEFSKINIQPFPVGTV
ncbi:MAG: mechanosensitive ion channel family protein [Treponema sp.]|jgi:small-conductance mechanosensitive channel|nr:mechanosensitive ion channel family protein [Treponema sp.]